IEVDGGTVRLTVQRARSAIAAGDRPAVDGERTHHLQRAAPLQEDRSAQSGAPAARAGRGLGAVAAEGAAVREDRTAAAAAAEAAHAAGSVHAASAPAPDL